MRILLITSGFNNVRESLSVMDTIELIVIDVCNYASNNKSMFFRVLKKFVTQYNPQVLITWRCPYILPQELFSIPIYGSYNLHPSLLPKYPGLNPWDDLYNHKESKTGVTLHKITNTVDDGDIIYQQEFLIKEINYDEARNISDIVAGNMIRQFIEQYDFY